MPSINPHYTLPIVNTNRWLARLSFSFFIIAAVLLWEMHKISLGQRGTVPGWRIGMYLVGVVLAISLGILGVRARHRGDDDRAEDDH